MFKFIFLGNGCPYVYFYQTDNSSLQSHFRQRFLPGWRRSLYKAYRIYSCRWHPDRMDFEVPTNSWCHLPWFSTLIIFNNRLIRKASDKKLIFRRFFEIRFAQFQQAVTVCQQGLNNCLHVIISLK